MWRSKFLLQREADGIRSDSLFAIITSQQRIRSNKKTLLEEDLLCLVAGRERKLSFRTPVNESLHCQKGRGCRHHPSES